MMKMIKIEQSKRKWLIILIIFMVLFTQLISSMSSGQDDTVVSGGAVLEEAVGIIDSAASNVVAPAVVSALENEETVPIIVTLKKGLGEDSNEELTDRLSNELEEKVVSPPEVRQLDVINGFSVSATKETVEFLSNNQNIDYITLDRPIYLLLDSSRPQINADDLHMLSVNGEFINGTGETVCIIDTGVDYTHGSLGGCTLEAVQNGSCSGVIGGIDIADNDTDPMDTHGHGTHIAGIVASRDSTYKGIAPGAKIVAVKVFPDGSVETPESMVIAGIDWCRTNAALYNISVITLSLGDGWDHTENCDDDLLAAAVNNVVAAGIFVDAASGNNGFSTGLVSPACASNVTSVGSVNEADAVSGFSNSASFLDLLAPGNSITSLKLGGGLQTYSGTSMAAPHAAGAAALLQQYWKKAYGIIPTAQQIEDKLKSSGKSVLDTRNNFTFFRIDLLSAVTFHLSFAEESIANNSLVGNASVFIAVNSDVNLAGAILQLSASNSSVNSSSNYSTNNSINNSINMTMNSLNASYFFLNLTNLTQGNYSYSVFAYDAANVSQWSSSRRLSVDLATPEIVINAPQTNISYNNAFFLNISVKDQFNLSEVNYSIFNSSKGIVRTKFINQKANETNQQNEQSGFFNGSSFYLNDLINVSNSTYGNGNYTLAIFAKDSVFNSANISVMFVVLNNPPYNLTLILPSSNSVLEVGNLTAFSAAAEDAEGDNLTYSWNFSDGSDIAYAQNISHLFNTTGIFMVAVKAADSRNFVQMNFSLMVNDTTAPTTTTITYDKEHHLQRDGVLESVVSSFFDYSGIANATLFFNTTKQNSSCQAAKTTRSCSWDLSNLSAGTHTFVVNVTDNFTIQHTISTTYSFSITSCSDGVENGNEKGVDCGGSCSVSCNSNSSSSNNSSNSSSSSSSSSSGGSGGGSGGGSSASTDIISIKAAETANTAAGEAAAETTAGEINENPSAATGEGNTASAESSSSSLTGGAVVNTGKLTSMGKKIALIVLGALCVVFSAIYVGIGWRRR